MKSKQICYHKDMRQIFALFIFISSTELFATTMTTTTFEQKVKDSELICAFKVVAQETRLAASRSIPLTVSTLASQECFKGKAQDEVMVSWPGGQSQKKRTRVLGTPDLKVGDEAILFLQKDKEFYMVHSWDQGVLKMKWNSQTSDYDLSSISMPQLKSLKIFREAVKTATTSH